VWQRNPFMVQLMHNSQVNFSFGINFKLVRTVRLIEILDHNLIFMNVKLNLTGDLKGLK